MRSPGGGWLSLAEFIAGAELEKQVSAVKFSDLNLADRIDAEYFLPVYLKIATALEGKGKQIKELAKLTCSAFYPAATHLYEEGDTPFLRCVDVINYPTITSDQPFVKIPKQFVRDNNSVRVVRTGDIVITKVGTPCYAGIVDESLDFAAISRTVLGLVNIDSSIVDPYYLVAFLRSDYGFFQLMREREQQIQLQLTLERVGDVNVFLPSLDVQKEVGNVMKQHYETVKKSKDLYQEAETMLLDALELDTLDVSPQLTYTATSEDAFTSNRFDAEHFQPKYYNTLGALENLNLDAIIPLSELVTLLTNGHTPTRHNLAEGDVTFLTAEHVHDFKLSFDSDKRILKEHHETILNRTQLEDGDILITIKGRVGNVAVVEGLEKPTNINQDVALLKLKPGIHPYYIAGLLNSQAGKMLTEHVSTGQINPFLSLTNLQTVLIPIFDPTRMDELGAAVEEKVHQARAAENEAKGLLEKAKARVEKLILDSSQS